MMGRGLSGTSRRTGTAIEMKSRQIASDAD